MIRSVLLAACLFALGAGERLVAQAVDTFAQDSPLAFATDLDAFVNASKRRAAKELTDALEERLPSYTAEQQASIFTLANQMLARGMQAAPYFEDYLAALAEVPYADDAGARTFTQWQAALSELLAGLPNRQFKGYLDFLAFSRGFFARQALETSGGLTWYARSQRFDIAMSSGGEPIVHFDTLDLVGVRRGDSIAVQRTSGDYFPAHHTFEGAGGKAFWDRLGLNDAYVYLKDYSVDLTSSLYEADSVRMTYPEYFGDERVWGSFSDKVTSTEGEKTGTYPRFWAYDSALELDDLGEGLHFTGGFRMEGLTVYGDTREGREAEVSLSNEGGKVVYRGTAPAFIIRRGQRVVGNQVRSVFYHGADSISHPSATFRYDIPQRVITLTRGDGASDRSPFYSSLQDVNIGAEEVKVYVAQDSVVFGERKETIGKASEAMEIESLQYFSGRDYGRYQNIATFNPLSVIRAVAQREGNVLDGEALAQKIDPKFTLANIKTLLFDLASNGFVDFDLATGQVTVREKLFHFVEASQGKRDYDALRIKSKTVQTNAVLDLPSGDMLVNGVRQLEFSRKQRVAIVPLGQQLLMKSNRNIDFDGLLYAGNATLEGKDMHFEYDPYQIVLDSIRYLDLFAPEDVEEGEELGEPLAIASRIEHVRGVLLIDAPGNKSGEDDIPIFPSLQTTGPSYIYYRGGSIDPLANVRLDSAMVRDSFYFELDEFSINGLDRFSIKDLRFTGKMHTASVFDPYPAEIYLRDDRSFGHVARTADSGWGTYAGKGKFTGTIDLSNRGMNAEGKLKYLTATISADDFVFEEGRVTGTAESFDLAEDRTGPLITPEAHGRDVSIEWVPYRDSMYVRSEESAFDLFEAPGHSLEGRLVLTPDGLIGQGVHDSPELTIRSEALRYGAYSARADTLSIAIKTADGEGVALEAQDLGGAVDWDAGTGEFVALDDYITVELPANMYTTSMNSFRWDMADGTVKFRTRDDEAGVFESLDPAQDSLTFRGQSASYNLQGTTLDIGGVPHIATADALVFLPDGEVQVDPSGKLRTLTGARIVADTVNQYHIIDSATVEIAGRRAYTASGYYRYDVQGREQQVFLGEIVGEPVGKGAASQKGSVTRASGEIAEGDDFRIDDRTRFRGLLSFDASRPEVMLDGFARLDAPGVPGASWFSVTTPGDKADLRLHYDLPSTPDGADLHTGVYLEAGPRAAYPLLLMPTEGGRDRPLLDVSEGLLDYDPATHTFLAGDSSRVLGGSRTGKLLRVDAETGAVSGSGPLELGSELDYISMRAAGTVSTTFPGTAAAAGGGGPDSATATAAVVGVEAMVSVDLIIPEKLLNLVAADIQAAGFDAPDVRYNLQSDFLAEAMPNWLSNPADSGAVTAARQGGGFMLPPDETGHAFLFPHLRLRYDPDYQSFFSADPKLDVSFIGANPVHKQLDAYLEVKMPPSGDDRFYFYLKSPGESWYFFGYKQGILEVASSSPRFMEAVDGLKKRELIYKMDDGETYEIAPGGASTANAFVNRVKSVQGKGD